MTRIRTWDVQIYTGQKKLDSTELRAKFNFVILKEGNALSVAVVQNTEYILTSSFVHD